METRPTWLRPTCIALLLGALAIDMFTPQGLVIGILFNAPIALSSLALDRRFTQWLIVAALLANAGAGYFDGMLDGYHWDAIAIGNRVICSLSFLLVGLLSVASQSTAKRAGELAERQERAARERGIQRAVDRIRASVNADLIARAMVREAFAALSVDAARVYLFASDAEPLVCYASAGQGRDVDVTRERPPAELASLLERLRQERPRLSISPTDPLGRLLLDTLGGVDALAATIVEHEAMFGAFIVVRKTASFEPNFADALDRYVEQAGIAFAQAALFAQLAERNDELGRANGALRERNNVIRDIVYALSHDLRTPLAAAGMTFRQALAGAFGALPDTYRRVLERTEQSNDELQRLAETLLLVSRYESGDSSNRRESVDVDATVASVVDELEPLWTAKSLNVHTELEARPTVSGDSGELRRALINLVANAVHWTPTGGEIAIVVDAGGDRATVRIEDSGYGVPEAERGGLFERTRTAPARKGAGTGIGLYLVRLIAERHGGSVRYEPRPAGGSIFTLELPLLSSAVHA